MNSSHATGYFFHRNNTERLGRVEANQKILQAEMQAQIEALRQELAELKAQMALKQGVAAAE